MVFSGDKLKKLREKRKLTLRELSAELEKYYGHVVVDYSTLARWESNTRACPRKSKLSMVADYLNVDINDFYIDADEAIEVEVDVLALITRIIDISRRNPKDIRLYKIENLLR